MLAKPSFLLLRVKCGKPMLIGYMRVSKADGSQVLDLQRDALTAVGRILEHLEKPAPKKIAGRKRA